MIEDVMRQPHLPPSFVTDVLNTMSKRSSVVTLTRYNERVFKYRVPLPDLVPER